MRIQKLGTLRRGYRRTTLGECATFINGRAYSQAELLDVGTPVLRIQNLNGGDRWYYSDLSLPPDKYCEDGDLLFAWSASFGPYIWRGPKSIFHYHIWKVIPGPDLDKQFAYYLLSYITNELKASARGIAMMHLTKSGIEAWQVDLPPIDEQRRLAAMLDQVEALRSKRCEALAILRHLGISLFDRDIVEGADPSSRIPLGDVCTKITDGTHQAPKWAERGIPFIFVSNIRNGSISFKTDKFVSAETYAELTRSTPVERGDVLYTSVGSYGNAAVVDTDQKFIFQRHIAQLKINKDRILPTFLAAMLESPFVRQQVDRIAKGAAQKTVTLGDLKTISVLCPPLEIQREFEQRVAAIATTKEKFLGHFQQLNRLFSSLKQSAFGASQ